MNRLIILTGVLTAILFGPLILRLSFLFLCIAWDVIFSTRCGVKLYDSIYGAPKRDKESV